MTFTCISRVLDQSGISQACYIVEIYNSGLEPSICCLFAQHKGGSVTLKRRGVGGGGAGGECT